MANNNVAQQATSNPIENLALEVKIAHISSKTLEKYLMSDILVQLYRPNPEISMPEAPVRPLKPEATVKKVDGKEVEEFDPVEVQLYTEELREYRKEMKYYEMHKESVENRIEFNLDLNSKVKKAYQELTGNSFNYNVHKKNGNIPRGAFGPPGQGKTASYYGAAKKVCEMLDLNFVSHVTDNFVPKMNDFVVVTQETAGETSSLTFGGIPRADSVVINGITIPVMKKAMNYRFMVPALCAGGVILFDDVANANETIQNALLPVAQNGSFQGTLLENCVFGFTGNLGALDGTHTNEPSSAFVSRIQPFFVTDTLKDFVDRAYLTFNDEAGTYGFTTFLELMGEDKFTSLPEGGVLHGHACSRTHDNSIRQIRSTMEKHGGVGVGEEAALGEIYEIALSNYGNAYGNEVFSFYTSYFMGAAPMARDFIRTGKVDIDRFNAKYRGKSADDLNFGYHFGSACVDFTVGMMSSAVDSKDTKEFDKTFEKAILNFANAVSLLNGTEFSNSLARLKITMATNLPHLTEALKKNETFRELQMPVLEKMAHLINSCNNIDTAKRDIIIQTISGHDEMNSNNIHDLDGSDIAPRKIFEVDEDAPAPRKAGPRKSMSSTS